MISALHFQRYRYVEANGMKQYLLSLDITSSAETWCQTGANAQSVSTDGNSKYLQFIFTGG